MRALLHSAIREALPDHWISVATIQTVTTAPSASNQLLPTGGVDIQGMVNIPCRIGVLEDARPVDNEHRDSKAIIQTEHRVCKLNGYFPTILPRVMRAIVDGEVLLIRGVEHDSQKLYTRLRLEVVSPRG